MKIILTAAIIAQILDVALAVWMLRNYKLGQDKVLVAWVCGGFAALIWGLVLGLWLIVGGRD